MHKCFCKIGYSGDGLLCGVDSDLGRFILYFFLIIICALYAQQPKPKK